MTLRILGCAGLALILAGCRAPSPEQVLAEAARLRERYEKFQPDYLRGVEAQGPLAAESLAWIDGSATHAPRSQAVADGLRLTDRWARVYFVPRHMHEQLRFDRYSSPQVKDVQRRLLEALKSSYFELHDYQRYAQHASESSMHGMPPGRLPPQLLEFEARLLARPPAVDAITPLLDLLPSLPLKERPTNP